MNPVPGSAKGVWRARALHNGNALAFQARVAGSIPAARSSEKLQSQLALLGIGYVTNVQLLADQFVLEYHPRV